MIRHHRYLVTLGGYVLVDQATSYDEGNRKIIERARRNSTRLHDYEVIDTWTEPGTVEVGLNKRSLVWRAD